MALIALEALDHARTGRNAHRILLALEAKVEQLERRLLDEQSRAERSDPLFGRGGGAVPYSSAQCMAALAADEIAISFFGDGQEIRAFVVTNEQLWSYSAGDATALCELIDQYAGPPAPRWSRTAYPRWSGARMACNQMCHTQ